MWGSKFYNPPSLFRNLSYPFTKIVIMWKTRNILSLCPLKDKNDCKSEVIKRDCSFGSCYIGETKHNFKIAWNEHNNLTKSSEPSKHHQNKINHCFTWL